MVGGRVRVTLVKPRDETGAFRRGRPRGVSGAVILSCIGPAARADRRGWTMEQLTSSTTATLVLPTASEPGAALWLSAAWFDGRCRMSPMAKAVSVNLVCNRVVPETVALAA